MPVITMEGEVPTNLLPFETYQVYNCLDSAVTAQLFSAIGAQMNANHWHIYRHEKRLQALCLDLSTKGFPVDQLCLAELLWKLEKDAAKATTRLHKFCEAVLFPPLNPNSPKQVAELFYSHLNLPTIYEFDRKTKRRKVSTDRKALEKLATNYPIAAPFVNAIDAAKTAIKLAGVFKAGLEPKTGNLRCNFNPTGTETGRLSSQQNPFQRGTNAQNLTDEARQVICAPDGWAIVNIDLKTAESVAVGFISGDRNYINACLSGDVHTAGCRMVWPEQPWTGNIKEDRNLAEQPAYRIFSWRDLMKKGGHATNYYGKPRTVQQVAFLGQATIAFVEEFQEKYFTAFPGIADWHLRQIAQVQQTGIIVTPFGRERKFWGRPNDAETWREAIAFEPQSLVGDVWNTGLIQLQQWIIGQHRGTILPWNGKRFAPLPDNRAQVHDSGVFLVPIEALDELVPIMQDQLKVPIDFGDLGTMLIPTDVSAGRRWNKVPKKGGSKYMLEGLKDWKPGQALHWLSP